MKGKRNRKSYGFQKGHEALYRQKPNSGVEKPNRGIHRLTTSEFKSVMQVHETGVIATSNVQGENLESMVLRPSPEEPGFWENYNKCLHAGNNKTHIFVHRQKTAEMWNAEFRTHLKISSGCEGDLNWDDNASEKRGICWAMVLSCAKCGYKSKKYKLYEEVKSSTSGRKAAAPNIGLQVGLAKQGISSSGMIEILSATNTIPPSHSSLQKSANRVNQDLISANKADMKQRITNLQNLNKKRGLANEKLINIEADATYNNRLCSGLGKTPSQPATQATYVIAENVTAKKDIVHVGTYNKLCKCTKPKQGQIEHGKACTANLVHTAIIGNEGLYMKQGISDLNDQGMAVQYITLDGDSNANTAVKDIVQSSDPGREISVLRCTRHLTRTLERQIKRTQFSQSMFRGYTVKERTMAQSRFALDIGDRCNAEFNQIFREHSGEANCMKNKCSYVVDAIIDCYQGNCENCSKHSYVCKGPNKPWPRPYLNTKQDYKSQVSFIQPNSDDITKLRNAIEIRLGQEAISKTFLNTNQNKCEAVNRGLSKGVPKHITFTRNYPGRVHACIHAMNNLPGTSICQLCQVVGAPIAPRSGVSRALERLDIIKTADQKRKKSEDYKEKRAKLRQDRYIHHDFKLAEMCYSKEQADIDQNNIDTDYLPRLRRQRCQTQSHNLDHNYMTRGNCSLEHNYCKL
jgi:hypothetical protein